MLVQPNMPYICDDSILEFPQSIRIHLLAYPDIANGNVAVRVTNVRRLQTSG